MTLGVQTDSFERSKYTLYCTFCEQYQAEYLALVTANVACSATAFLVWDTLINFDKEVCEPSFPTMS